MSDLVHATCIVCGADDRIERIKVGGEWYERERTCHITGWDPLDDADGYDDRLCYLSCGHTAVVCLGPMGTMDTLDEFVECPECHVRVVDE